MLPRVLLTGLCSLMLAVALNVSAAVAAVKFIGQGVLPGDTTDQSGLSGLLEDGVTPQNQAGGFGSAIAYTGKDHFYVATPDRGPADGTTSYIDRFYTIRINVKRLGADTYEVTPTLAATRLMRQEARAYFTGSAAAFDGTGSPESLRFDPEGVRVSACGHSIFVSDEYGPYIYEFSLASGKRLRSIPVPNKFLIDYPSATPSDELSVNRAGRQANRGMEGLAISPDGTKLYGIMQSPLLQDGGLDSGLKRVGLNVRIVEIDIESLKVREFLYQLDDKGNGISEILAANDHEFLVLERDGNAGAKAAFKKVFKIDITGATDIRKVQNLPTSGTPTGITPVKKDLFIDMLNPAFGLAGATFPEKIEGLAFGPDLRDGRHTLVVTSDNDFIATQPSRFFVFAIDHNDLPKYMPQDVARWHSRECFAQRMHDDRED